ncbi:MAG TPA: aminoglycoside phosphotransferase family protein [Actinoplanes sp.]
MVQATGVRIGWRDMPAPVQARVEQIIGGRVIEAVSQTGGFSPGTADRVCTADGRRAFVKAVTPMINLRSAELARQELLITAALPAHAPVPRMLGGFDDGEWVVLVLADVEGVHPRTPWVDREVDAAVTTLRELAAALTPAPPIELPTATDNFGGDFAGWDQVAADPPADLEPWFTERLPDLQAAAARGRAALGTGDTLMHCDIRADNILVRPDGSMVVVDWPWACVGPAWLDTVLLALNVMVHGGDAERVICDLDPQAVTDVVAGMTGMFRHVCRLPPPPGIPTVRAFQRWQSDALLPWLRSRMG